MPTKEWLELVAGVLDLQYSLDATTISSHGLFGIEEELAIGANKWNYNATSPYLSVVFPTYEREDQGELQARLALQGVAAIWNRLRLRGRIAEMKGQRYIRTCGIVHFGVSIKGIEFRAWIFEAKEAGVEFYSHTRISEAWPGCKMSPLFSGKLNDPIKFAALVEFLDQVHTWGTLDSGKVSSHMEGGSYSRGQDMKEVKGGEVKGWRGELRVDLEILLEEDESVSRGGGTSTF